MKIEVVKTYGRVEIFDVTDYEMQDGVLSLFLTNGSFIQYSPYDWLCIKILKDSDKK